MTFSKDAFTIKSKKYIVDFTTETLLTFVFKFFVKAKQHYM